MVIPEPVAQRIRRADRLPVGVLFLSPTDRFDRAVDAFDFPFVLDGAGDRRRNTLELGQNRRRERGISLPSSIGCPDDQPIDIAPIDVKLRESKELVWQPFNGFEHIWVNQSEIARKNTCHRRLLIETKALEQTEIV